MKTNIKNERVKRRFFNWLRHAGRCCDSTINNIEKAIILYEDFTKQADFRTFSPKKAVEFKKSLAKREFRGKTISLTTYHTYLRYLQKFLDWLCDQPGYKSKIRRDMVDYLNLTEKEERIATQFVPRNYPSLEYVVKLANSIEVKSEIDLRDRALISFTLLSGMRVEAIATLPLGCFDEETLKIIQDPKEGVRTKFSKYIPSTLLKFDDNLVSYVIEWVKHLKDKGFGSQDPLFPRSKTEQGKDNLSFEPAKEVEPVFWRGTGMIRQIFKNRSSEVGLPYHSPHTFRHLAFDLALKHCENGEQMKAVSQNFGHEYIATTFASYANFAPQRLHDILKRINFSGKPSERLEDKLDKLPEQIKNSILKILLDKEN
jgi:integrase/recombinase XerD